MFFSKKKSTRKSRFWTNFTKNNKNWKQTENNCLKKYVENVTIPLLRQILHYFMLFYFIQNQSLIAVLSGSWTPRLSYFNLWSSFWFCVSCPTLLQKGEISSFFCQNFTYTYKIFKIMHYALRTCYQPGAPPMMTSNNMVVTYVYVWKIHLLEPKKHQTKFLKKSRTF